MEQRPARAACRDPRDHVARPAAPARVNRSEESAPDPVNPSEESVPDPVNRSEESAPAHVNRSEESAPAPVNRSEERLGTPETQGKRNPFRTVRLKRAESPEAPSPGHRPGYNSNQQDAL